MIKLDWLHPGQVLEDYLHIKHDILAEIQLQLAHVILDSHQQSAS